ncbi:MAG: hypothetical protein ACOZDY_13345 [Pseudomonadota bacterium]
MRSAFLPGLPDAVAAWADEKLRHCESPDKEILGRLCSDARMSGVWADLAKRSQALEDSDRALVAYAREAWLASGNWDRLDKTSPKEREKQFEELLDQAERLRRKLRVRQGPWRTLDDLQGLLRESVDRRDDLRAQAIILGQELSRQICASVRERLVAANGEDQTMPAGLPEAVDSAVESAIGGLLSDPGLGRYFPSLSNVLETLCQRSVSDLAFGQDLAEQLLNRKLTSEEAKKIFCIRVMSYMARDLFGAPMNQCVADTVTTALDLLKPINESTVRENTKAFFRGILPEVSG